jgi:hypothetical protein
VQPDGFGGDIYEGDWVDNEVRAHPPHPPHPLRHPARSPAASAHAAAHAAGVEAARQGAVDRPEHSRKQPNLTSDHVLHREWVACGVGRRLLAKLDRKLFRPEHLDAEGSVCWQRHGKGTLSVANGDVFQGEWKQGSKHGPGTFFYEATQKRYDGVW